MEKIIISLISLFYHQNINPLYLFYLIDSFIYVSYKKAYNKIYGLKYFTGV